MGMELPKSNPNDGPVITAPWYSTPAGIFNGQLTTGRIVRFFPNLSAGGERRARYVTFQANVETHFVASTENGNWNT